MNRAQRREMELNRQKVAKKKMALSAGPFELITSVVNRPDWMSRAYQNNWYFVYIDDNAPTTHGPAIKAMVQRLDNVPIPNHWSEMQKIKNALFGEETVAVEYYPQESELLNTHNIYWMWIYPPNVMPKPLR